MLRASLAVLPDSLTILFFIQSSLCYGKDRLSDTAQGKVLVCFLQHFQRVDASLCLSTEAAPLRALTSRGPGSIVR